MPSVRKYLVVTIRTHAGRLTPGSFGISSGHTGRSKFGPNGLAGSAVAPPPETTPGSASRRSIRVA